MRGPSLLPNRIRIREHEIAFDEAVGEGSMPRKMGAAMVASAGNVCTAMAVAAQLVHLATAAAEARAPVHSSRSEAAAP